MTSTVVRAIDDLLQGGDCWVAWKVARVGMEDSGLFKPSGLGGDLEVGTVYNRLVEHIA